MANFALWLRFDGTNYHGWQLQKNGITVQEVLTRALQGLTGEQVSVTGCSRTDAGVHALTYVCSFRSGTKIPTEKLPLALNTRLPRDIRAQRCKVAQEGFNARKSARSKTYLYRAYNSPVADPFLLNYAYHFPYGLDMAAMERACAHLVGRHDFSAFMSAGGSQKTTVRTVTALSVGRRGDLIEIRISADAYLYNMVRIIAGTLLYVGIGRIGEEELPGIIRSGRRSQSGITAGPMGLYLAEVRYDDDEQEKKEE